MTVPIAIVGVGKIAVDQHIPSIAASSSFHLAGAVSRGAREMNVPVRSTLRELKAASPDLAAIAICTPPVGRLDVVKDALDLGLHVLLEKPPAKTLAEAEEFARLAKVAEPVLYQSWHSQCAPAVEPMRLWLSDRTVQRAEVRWMEDVRVWHPAQEWIWSPGIGVFDPGINALSILTEIMPMSLSVVSSILSFPENRQAPIAADIMMAGSGGVPVDVRFSFDQRGPQSWTIQVDCAEGLAELLDGGARWTIDGVEQPVADDQSEYTRVYENFAKAIAHGSSDVDLRPFRLVADAFLLAERQQVQAFQWNS